jgi:O-antigen/teichoic acid export membrane protein
MLETMETPESALAEMETPAEAGEAATPPRPSVAASFTRNSLISVGRLAITTVVGLVLPSYLIHKMPVNAYSAWVLILQMSAYVTYLDFGIQTGIAKYVAEFEARNDPHGASVRASAGFALMAIASFTGVLVTLVLAWRVPQLFHDMPRGLFHDVRLSLTMVGVSVSLSLLCSICASIFLGLQRYAVPMTISLINRIVYTVVILGAVYLHQSLTVMGAAVAVVNLGTGALQVAAWWKMAPHVELRLKLVEWQIMKRMLAYCSSLAVWTVGMLCVSGLDLTIVGRYDFGQTAFYAVAISPTNFMIAILGAALAPLMPAASALSVHKTPAEMGSVLSRITRYSSIMLFATALPLLVGGYWLLRVWVGPAYAVQILPYMRILVLANVVRYLCAPYASMLVATESQAVAIAGVVSEAVVNLTCSLILVRHIGAIGVAYGTLIGSFVSVGMHFAVSMHFTYRKFSISRVRLFLEGIGRPLLLILPAALLVRAWWRPGPPAFAWPVWPALTAASLLVLWYATLGAGERGSLLGWVMRRLRSSARYVGLTRYAQ